MFKNIKFFIGLLTLILIPNLASAATSGLQDSAWPVFHGDSKLTGQSKYDTSKIKGGVKWKFKSEGQIETSPVVDKDGNIYFVDQKCNLYAITPEGKEKWKFDAGEPVISKEWGGFGSCSQSSPAIDKDGTVYFLPMTGNFFAVDKDGKEKWRYEVHTFKNAWPSPAIGPDGTIYVGSESYPPPETGKPQEKSAVFYAFNLDGTLKWEYEATGASWVNSAPSFADDGTIYTTSNDCKRNCANGVFAFNPDGTVKWIFLPPNGVLEGSVVVGNDGTLYFTAKGADDPRRANFYAVTPDGKEKWKFPLENGASITPGLSSDGKIYFGDWGGIFYALDLNGKELWRIQTPAAYESLSSSPAIGADGTIYFGTIADYFFAITPDGKEKWKFYVGEGGVGSSPAIGKDGTVYFASIRGWLYAIGEGKAKDNPKDENSNTNANSSNIRPNSNTDNFAKILISVLGGLIITGLVLMVVLKKRGALNWKRSVIILSIQALCIAGIIFSFFFFKPQSNNQPKTKQNSKNERCPRRVYGASDSGYYGIYEMQQIDMKNEEVEWARKNCPDTYFVGDPKTGQPNSAQ